MMQAVTQQSLTGIPTASRLYIVPVPTSTLTFPMPPVEDSFSLPEAVSPTAVTLGTPQKNKPAFLQAAALLAAVKVVGGAIEAGANSILQKAPARHALWAQLAATVLETASVYGLLHLSQAKTDKKMALAQSAGRQDRNEAHRNEHANAPQKMAALSAWVTMASAAIATGITFLKSAHTKMSEKVFGIAGSLLVGLLFGYLEGLVAEKALPWLQKFTQKQPANR